MSSAETRTGDWRGIVIGRPEQKEAIFSDASLTVISAGAGTGKTHTLAQRFAWLLASDSDCGVDEILVLTFTEKAAREMRERIGATVEKWLAAYPLELKHLEKSIKNIDDAYISTIHSFAMKVIRESALELDIDPTASIILAPKEDLWWERFASTLDSLSPSPLLCLLDREWRMRAELLFGEPEIAVFISEYGPEGLAAAAKNAGEILGSSGKTPEDLWNQTAIDILGDVESMGDYAQSTMELWITHVLPEITPEQRAKPDNTLRRLVEILAEYSELEINKYNGEKFCLLLFTEGLATKLPSSSKIKDAVSRGLGESLREWRDRELRNYAKTRPPSEEELLVASLLNRLCALGWYCWDALRLQEGVLSMNDLIRYAGEVLEKTPSYGNRFRHILVDEFQDTDRLQEKLLTSLWNEERNSLFLVGDLKQSIYRFRHADLRIFQDYILKARGGASDKYKYVTLDHSYRTKGELLSRFNDIFSNLWSGGLEKGTSMVYEPLRGPEDEKWWEGRNTPELIPPFEVFLSATGNLPEEARKQGEKDVVNTARRTLFRELANKIAGVYARKDRVWDGTGDKPGMRETRWRDFAVLVPTRGVYPLIEEAFDEAGIPYVLNSSKSYFSRGEIADATGLVSLLADPANPLYLAGWISSPLSGAPYGSAAKCLEDARRIKKNGEPLPLAEIVKAELPETWAEIERLRRLALLSGVSFAILELLRKPFVLSFYEPQQRRSVLANLIRLAQVAGEYEDSEGVSLPGFADYLRLAALSEGHTEEPDVTDDDEDAVCVLTIHASKGLEFPVTAVFCAEAGRGRPGRVIISPRYGIVPKKIPAFLGGDGTGDTVMHLWHGDSDKEKDTAERERLYYVALTRTRDKLFLCATGSYDDKTGEYPHESFGAFMQTVLDAGYGDPPVKCVHMPYSRRAASLWQANKQARQESIALELPETPPAKLGRLSASAYATLTWCPQAYRIAYRQGRNMSWMVKSGEEQGGADFGSLAHWILSHWDFNTDALEKWLPQAETNDFTEARGMLPPYLREIFTKGTVRGELRAMLLGCVAGHEGEKIARLTKQGRLEREVSFRVYDGGLWLTGSVDIMWEEDGGLHIRDWKTSAEETAPGEYYDAQLNFYAYAVHCFRNKSGLPDKDIYTALNYIRLGESGVTPLYISEKKIKQIGAQIHAAAELALSSAFSGELGKCAKCPWRKDCAV